MTAVSSWKALERNLYFKGHEKPARSPNLKKSPRTKRWERGQRMVFSPSVHTKTGIDLGHLALLDLKGHGGGGVGVEGVCAEATIQSWLSILWALKEGP